MKSVAYYTLGCKVNQCETEQIRAELERCGFTTVPFSSSADIYVINTCSVTSTADSKSRAAIRKAIKQNSEAFVVVTGCFAELEPGQVSKIEGVDLVVPNTKKEQLAERLLSEFSDSLSSVSPMLDSPCRASESSRRVRPRTRTRAVVKVQDGCDQFCSYCIVPFARPKMHSRPVSDVIKELELLAEFGYKEIVLSGIRLGSYGYGLPELIRKAAEVKEIERIRLSSIEPWEVSDDLLNAMQTQKLQAPAYTAAERR